MKNNIAGIILTVLSLLLTTGVLFIFPACKAKEDGSWMMCHWAGQVVFAVGFVMTVISLITLILGGRKAAAGASLSLIPTAIFAALVPDLVIPLCKMPTMHCHTVMRPAVIAISALIAVTAAVNAVIILKRKENK